MRQMKLNGLHSQGRTSPSADGLDVPDRTTNLSRLSGFAGVDVSHL